MLGLDHFRSGNDYNTHTFNNHAAFEKFWKQTWGGKITTNDHRGETTTKTHQPESGEAAQPSTSDLPFERPGHVEDDDSDGIPTLFVTN